MPLTINNDFKEIRYLNRGGGGWLIGYAMAANGRMVSYGDTYGAWLKEPTGTSWKLLLASDQMTDASGDTPNIADGTGVSAAAICDANPQAIGFVYKNKVYYRKSDTALFTATNFTAAAGTGADSNGNTVKGVQKKLAIDPINDNVIYAAWNYSATGAQGLHRSLDARVTASRITSVPLPTSASSSGYGMGSVFIDPTSTNTGSGSTLRKSRVITTSYGNGVYYSLDGGDTFTQITGSPTTSISGDMAIDGNGVIWMGYDGGLLYKLSPTNVLTQVTVAGFGGNGGMTSVAAAGNRIIIGDYTGVTAQSMDGGATWSATNHTYNVNSGDTPWIATQTGINSYFSSTWFVFDKGDTTKLWTLGGQGLWWSIPPTTAYNTTTIQWYCLADGIDQGVTNGVMCLPDGRMFSYGWDFIALESTFPLIKPTKRAAPYDNMTIIHATAMKFLESNPLRQVYTCAQHPGVNAAAASMRTLDGGTTWSEFTNYPPFTNYPSTTVGALDKAASGEITEIGPNNYVWVPRGSFRPFYTLDGGATAWNVITLLGVGTGASPNYSELNPSSYFFDFRRLICWADPLIAGKAWIYHPSAGTFVTTNGGAAWTLASATTFTGAQYHAKFKPMWDRSNTVVMTTGSFVPVGPTNGDFAYSTNGAVTWTTHPDIKCVTGFSFGTKLNGQGYPSLYFFGAVNGNTLGNNGYGLYVSDDFFTSQNVRKLSNGPIAKSFDFVGDIGASRKHRDLVTIAFGGSTGAVCYPSAEGYTPIFHG